MRPSDKHLKILYLLPLGSNSALQSNFLRRKYVLNQLGHSVKPFILTNSVLRNFCLILKLVRRYDLVIIRIDGSCQTDRYSVIKLLRPVKMIWEIHGFPEENYFPPVKLTHSQIFRKNCLRRFYSLFADDYIFVTGQLKAYASAKISPRPNQVIRNFAAGLIKAQGTNKIPYLPKNKYKILWTGDARYPWQATDLVERLALHFKKTDSNMLFVIAGPKPYYKIRWGTNLIQISAQHGQNYYNLIKEADLCLALYHRPPGLPFYFSPLKILDYMICGKPIIATGLGGIKDTIKNKQNGILTDNNLENLAFEIKYLKTHRAAANRLGQNAKESVTASYGLNYGVEQYREALKIVLGDNY